MGAQDDECTQRHAKVGACQSQTGSASDLDGRDQGNAEQAFDHFLAKYGAKYDRATQCLAKDRDVLLTFYDVPAEHGKHVRTSNPIESTFATVRHRTKRSKGCLSRVTAKVMVFKMIKAAERSWRKLDGQNQLPKIIDGVKFINGIEVKNDNQAAA